MSRYLFCDNPREHQREAEHDFRTSPWPDREHEHRSAFDSQGCDRAYMDRFEELRRERDEERRFEEQQEDSRARRRHHDEQEEEELREQAYAYEAQRDDGELAEYERACAEHYFRDRSRRWFQRNEDAIPF